MLNHKSGKPTLLTVYNPDSEERKDITVKPISGGQEYQLLYERWVDNMEQLTEELSDGRIGYVHVRGMNSSSYREFYSKVLGENFQKEALIVDTRFNGGGWLHDDLVHRVLIEVARRSGQLECVLIESRLADDKIEPLGTFKPPVTKEFGVEGSHGYAGGTDAFPSLDMSQESGEVGRVVTGPATGLLGVVGFLTAQVHT